VVHKASITIVVDNYSKEGFLNEWGLSLFIETDSWSMIFDADTNPKTLAINISKLGIDLSKIDFAFLSHHHGDHYGGFKYIGKMRPNLRVFTPPGDIAYLRLWGLNPVVVNESKTLADGAWSTGPLKLPVWGIREHAFAFYIENRGLIIVVGCSHPGLLKLINKAVEVTNSNDVYLVIGGFHELSCDEADKLASFTKYIAPLHCTNIDIREYIRSNYSDKYLDLRVGDTINLPLD